MSSAQREARLERRLREALITRKILKHRLVETEAELKALRKRFERNERNVATALDGLGRSTRVARPRLGRKATFTLAQRSAFQRPTLRRDIKPVSLRLRDLKIPQAAAILLREARAPQHVHELHNRMLENGLELRGAHPAISIAVSLSRSKKFRKVAPGTFELARPIEASRKAS